MATTTRLGITLLEAAQEQKETTVNDALNTIDAAIAALALTNNFTGTNTFSGPVGIGTTSPTARLHISRLAAAANPSNPSYLKIVGAADTAMAASTEVNDILYDLSRTLQFATGALTNQRASRILAPTYAFVGASTITNAATVAVSGAPIAGTNATITNAYALWVESGGVQIGSQAINALVGISRAAVSSGNPAPLLKIANVTDTGMTASTEASSVIFDCSASRQFATGALTTQRSVQVLAPTYTFVGASTITTAATFAVSGAPVAGTNATITAAYALWVQAGSTRLDGNCLVNGQMTCTMAAGLDVPWRWNALVFTFPGDADQTLTATQASSPYIDVQAGVITAQRNIVVPLGIGEFFIVRNRQATFGVQIIGATGTGTVVAAGKMAVLLGSGSNIIRVTPDTTP